MSIKNEKIEITVETVRGSIELELPRSTKVNEVIRVAVEHLGLGRPDIYELVCKGRVMRPTATLMDYEVKTGNYLDLTRITVVGL